MNKSGGLFNSVIHQVQRTDAARLSTEYAMLREAIVQCKVSQLREMRAPPPPEITMPPLQDTKLPHEAQRRPSSRRHIAGSKSYKPIASDWSAARRMERTTTFLSGRSQQ